MRKILFFSYYFPPLGGGGVQRITRFCKYLPEFGYQPVVVAAKDVFVNQPEDTSLQKEVEKITRYNIENLGPIKNNQNKLLKRIFVTHKPQWFAPALKAGQKAIENEKPDLLCATVSPFPMAAVTGILAKKYDIPYIVDMRDPWALDPINYYSSILHYWIDLIDMRAACKQADAIIMNTPDSLEAARKSFPGIPADKFTCITNGWDAQDFSNVTYPAVLQDTNKPLTIVHTGVFHTKYALTVNPSARKTLKNGGKKLKDWIKFSVGAPNLLTRTPYYLFSAIALLLKENKISHNDIKLVMAGDYTKEDIILAQNHGLKNMVDFRGYLDHHQSVQIFNQANVLFLPLHEPKNGMLPLIVPGKTYEYLAARRPILALVPAGDAESFVKKSGLGYVCEPTNVNQIAATLLNLLNQYRSPKGLQVNPDCDFINQFERKALTKRLAELFNTVLSKRIHLSK